MRTAPFNLNYLHFTCKNVQMRLCRIGGLLISLTGDATVKPPHPGSNPLNGSIGAIYQVYCRLNDISLTSLQHG